LALQLRELLGKDCLDSLPSHQIQPNLLLIFLAQVPQDLPLVFLAAVVLNHKELQVYLAAVRLNHKELHHNQVYLAVELNSQHQLREAVFLAEWQPRLSSQHHQEAVFLVQQISQRNLLEVFLGQQ